MGYSVNDYLHSVNDIWYFVNDYPYSVNDYFGVVYFKWHKNRFFTANFGQKKTETPIFQGISVVLPKLYLGGRRDRSRTSLTGSLNGYINVMKYRKYFYQ